MGSCCGSPRSFDGESLAESIGNEAWYQQRVYFDSASFKATIKKPEYKRIQAKLKLVWQDFEPPTSESEGKQSVKWKEIENYQPMLWKGVPYSTINPLIVFLFGLEEKSATEEYAAARARASESVAIAAPATTSKISSFMTQNGVSVAKEIYQTLQFECKNMEVCYTLPRVSQLLLWYLSQNMTYQLLHKLLTEQPETYFPMTASDYEEICARVLRTVMHGISSTSKLYFSELQYAMLVKDMMNNLLVGYVRPEYFGCVVMAFLGAGVMGIARIAAMLIMCTSSSALGRVDLNVEENLKTEFQTSCMFGVDFLKILENASSLDLRSHQPDVEERRQAQFLPYSVILPSHESQAHALTYLPDETELLQRTFLSSSNVPSELYSTWKECTEPQLLLVRTSTRNIFGVYLDRPFAEFEADEVKESESMFIQIEPILEGKRHVKPFKVQLSPLGDLQFVEANRCVVSSEEGFLFLNQELKFGNRRPSLAFADSVKNDFMISEVELFVFKRAAPSSS